MDRRWLRSAPLLGVAALAALALALLAADDDRPPAGPGRAGRAARTRVGPTVALAAPGRDDDAASPAATTSATDAPASSGASAATGSTAPSPLLGRVLLDGVPWSGTLLLRRLDPRGVALEVIAVPTGADGTFEWAPLPGLWDVEAAGLQQPSFLAGVDPEWLAFGSEEGLRDAAERLLLAAEPLGPARYDPPQRCCWVSVTPDPERPGPVADRLWIDLHSPVLLEGRVVDAVTGRGLPAARVTVRPAHDAEPRQVALDADGAFRLVAARAWSEAILTAEAAGRGTVTSGWEWHELRTPRPGPKLVRLRPAFTVRGRLLDLAGRPLEGDVDLDTPGGDPADGGRGHRRSGRAGADGWFRFDDVGLGTAGPGGATISLTFHAPGHRWLTLEERPVGPASPPLEVRLDRLVPLSGRVVGPGGPVVGAWVTATGNHQLRAFDLPRDPERGDCTPRRTDATGAFVFEGITERSWLLVEATGLAPTAFEVRGPHEAPLEIQLLPAVSLRGRAVHADGAPAPGACVRASFHGALPLDGSNVHEEAHRLRLRLERPGIRRLDLALEGGGHIARASSDAAGWFQLDGLPPGARFDLRAGEWDAEPTVGAAPGDPVVVRVERDRPRCDVRALTVDELGAPLECGVTARDARGWWVQVDWHPAPRPPDFDPDREEEPRWPPGVVRAIVRRAGPLLLVFEAPGRPPVSRKVELRAGGEVDLGRVAVPGGGGRPALRVRWPDGPAPHLQVVWTDPVSGSLLYERPERPAAPDAPLVLAPTNAGPVTLEVSIVDPSYLEPDRPVARLPLVVVAGQTTEVELDLR